MEIFQRNDIGTIDWDPPSFSAQVFYPRIYFKLLSYLSLAIQCLFLSTITLKEFNKIPLVLTFY